MDEDVFKELEERESEAMLIQLTAAVQRTAITLQEYISMRALSGVDLSIIENELLNDLNNNGRIFGEFRSAIKATAHGNLRRVSDIGNYSENGIEVEYIWITVQDSNVCPECSPRHGQEEKWKVWEVLGLPATGWSVCRSNCRCYLALPEGVALAPEKPVIRARRKK